MNVLVTENLSINLDTEMWHCRRCEREIISARENYKRGLLVFERDPREVHKPILDPDRYEFTFGPDPTWTRILEYYCPDCGQMMEVEYLPPGHAPLHDIEFDIDALKRRRITEEGFVAEIEEAQA
jgi:acetone carboxylase gamma subunit